MPLHPQGRGSGGPAGRGGRTALPAGFLAFVARSPGFRSLPNLEKALTFLDEALLPSTSNAVERGNRRHRKMQKTVYRVRTQQHIQSRIALDMQRDVQADTRNQIIGILHYARIAS